MKKILIRQKKFKLKIGNFVRVDPPMLGVIRRKNKKIGYTIKVFASPDFEISYYSDEEIYKIPKKGEWVKQSCAYGKSIAKILKK